MYGEDDPREPPFDYDYQPQPESRRRYGGVIIGSLALLMFVIGIWFAYRQGVQNGVALTPPLIKADASPTKMLPENPGGMQVPNQDKTIYDRIDGSAEGKRDKIEKLLPPPEQPNPESQLAAAAPPPSAIPPAAAVPLAPAAPQGPANQQAAMPPVTAAPPGAVSVQPVPAPSTMAPPPLAAMQSASPTPPPAPPPPAPSAPVSLKPAAVPPAPAPAAKPAPAKPAVVAKVAPVTRTAPAERAGAGGLRIQLGAYHDADAATKDWQRLQKRYPSELRHLQPIVTRVDLGAKGIYHRLQAGPLPSKAAADSVCEKFKAQHQGCIVVAG